MKEIINIGVGTSGCRVSDAITNQLSYEWNLPNSKNPLELNSKPAELNATNLLFSQNKDGEYGARQIFLDSEPDVADEIRLLDHGKTYNTNNFITGKESCIISHNPDHPPTSSRNIKDLALDCVRKEVEKCDFLDAFTFNFSSAGGSGWMAPALMIDCKQEFPKKTVAAYYDIPWGQGSTSSSAINVYNAVFCGSYLLPNSDIDFFYHHQA
jgi:hypothetical protein